MKIIERPRVGVPADQVASTTAFNRIRVGMLLLRLRALIALIVLIIVFSFLSPSYLTAGNLIVMTRHVAINAILAIGQTFVILTGGIDLSVGSIAGITGMISGGLLDQGLALPIFGVVVFFSVPVVIAIGLLVGIVFGGVNGLAITRFRVAPFIATLGMLYVARGLAELRSNGGTFPNLAGRSGLGNTGFEFIGVDSVLGIPVGIWLMVLFGVVAALIAARTPFGRRVYAVGGNARAAVLSGIRVNRIKLAVYMISGFCAAMAGLILTSELGAAYPDTATTYELNAIAAAVLGGTSLSGGKGTIVGTIIGAFVIGFLSDGLVLVGVSTFWQLVVKGAVIVLAVVLDQAQERLQARITLR